MNQRIKKKKLIIQIMKTAKTISSNGIIVCKYPYGRITFSELDKVFKCLKVCVDKQTKIVMLPDYMTIENCHTAELIKMRNFVEELIRKKDKI